MKPSNNHRPDHCIAKAIICFVYILLGMASIIWFFGVNATGYMIECVRQHRHCHNKF